MTPAKLVYSLLLPVLVWLLYGAPSLALPGNLAILAAVLCQLYAMIWQRALYRALGGDEFTYGMLTKGLNFILFMVVFLVAGVTLMVTGGAIATPIDVSVFVWAVLLVCLLLTVSIPLLASRHVEPLPKASERREYENPADRH